MKVNVVANLTDCLVKASLFYGEALRINPKIKRWVDIQIASIDVFGYTQVEDVNSKKQPRHFLIVLKKGNREQLLQTLAHEMVHVKQWVNGEVDEEQTHWKGKKVKASKDQDVFPWEKEARALEKSLYQAFIESENSLI
jgi:fructose-1,6-bisphosphatase/sedoheptulose 1,7-bisphosphatase-like protein